MTLKIPAFVSNIAPSLFPKSAEQRSRVAGATLPAAPGTNIDLQSIPAPAWTFALRKKHPPVAPGPVHALGEKSFAAISAQLLAELPSDEAAQGLGQRLKQISKALDAALTVATEPMALAPQMTELRAQWRAAFIDVFHAADQAARAPLEQPALDEKKALKENAQGSASQSAPAINQIYAEGGGAKGQAMMGALLLLQASGEIGRLRGGMAGTSIGSMLASSVACGADMEAVSAAGLNENVKQLITKKVDNDPAIEMYKKDFGLSFHGVGKSAVGLITYMDTLLRTSMLDRLEMLAAQAQSADDGSLARIQEHQQALKASVSGPTFGQLNALANEFPQYFKQLSIPAFETGKSETIYFETGKPEFAHMPISLAIRASAALPPAFKRLEMKLGDRHLSLLDGGIKDKVPFGAFATSEPPADKKRSSALIYLFSRNGGSDKILHADEKTAYANNRPHPVAKLFSKAFFSMQDYRHAETASLRENALNVVVLGHGKIETTDFEASSYSRFVAQIEGEHDMARYMANRVGQALG